MNKPRMKIFIIGGHVTPAVGVIDEIEKKHPDWVVVFVGRKYAQEGDRHPSVEYEIMTSRGIRFLPIIAGRLQRSLSLQTIPSILKIPVGFIQATYYCLHERPQCIVSFGGYVAVPIAMVGALFGVPVITHEQTRIPGLSNKIIAKFAKKICVTFDETARNFPPAKTIVTGLPLRRDLFCPPSEFITDVHEKKYPIIYITGGATGATSLNERIFPLIGQLLKKYTVVHQIGIHSFHNAETIRGQLSKEDQARYVIARYFGLKEISWILHHAALVVCRSGANTVVELAVFGKIALCIPLPWSAGNEQYHNAKWLQEHGGANVLMQKDATPQKILQDIHQMMNSRDMFASRAKRLAPLVPQDGARRFVEQIDTIL
ncbi:hypothetical protein A2Z00_02125 [Candidatus Gottesmanbacteria bacterium RBG_13_45_10]|uniref:UDP-N-acetylglucosamine--N-acetylmuramyl-(pentapeptide) pyrophosphoryl-undecaprenol N-acetylglucosamine transferase n=1 Tax=Candidatus Gottesmanbacteria bacterium RBG_13_45_10 TaxID=1798370 RepID=A0A1F5ZGL4_9BACT|nr:MAG: hypothetical protein A2Z00_02125 [Candidatus Gottesmanbacteria bacterium RBG_13_45_10]